MTDKVTSLMRDALEKAKEANGDPKIILVYESLWASVLADTYTFGCLVICIMIGVAVSSAALQWIAGLMTVLYLFHLMGRLKEKSHYTIAEAREKLNKIERGEA